VSVCLIHRTERRFRYLAPRKPSNGLLRNCRVRRDKVFDAPSKSSMLLSWTLSPTAAIMESGRNTDGYVLKERCLLLAHLDVLRSLPNLPIPDVDRNTTQNGIWIESTTSSRPQHSFRGHLRLLGVTRRLANGGRLQAGGLSLFSGHLCKSSRALL